MHYIYIVAYGDYIPVHPTSLLRTTSALSDQSAAIITAHGDLRIQDATLLLLSQLLLRHQSIAAVVNTAERKLRMVDMEVLLGQHSTDTRKFSEKMLDSEESVSEILMVSESGGR